MDALVEFFYRFFTDIFSAIPFFVFIFLLVVLLFFISPKAGLVVAASGICLLIFFIYSATRRFENIYGYVYDRGITGELVINEFRGSGNMINYVEVTESVSFIKLENGEMLEIVFSNQTIPHYPAVKAFSIMTNKPYKIRYLRSNPKVFVFDAGSREDIAKEAKCQEIKKAIELLHTQLLLDPENKGIQENKKSLEAELQKLCLDEASVKKTQCEGLMYSINVLNGLISKQPENQGLKQSKENLENKLKELCKKYQ